MMINHESINKNNNMKPWLLWFQVKFSIAIILVIIALRAANANALDSVNLSYGGINPMPHCHAKIYAVEYEHSLTSTVAVIGRGSRVNYNSDDEAYQENGNLKGIDAGARYYPAGDMHGFFTGGSLGYWKGHWASVREKNTSTEWQDKASSNSLRVNIDFGFRIPLQNTNISIMPEASLGKFLSSSSCEYTSPASRIGTPCDQTSEVNYYLFLGVAIGFAF